MLSYLEGGRLARRGSTLSHLERDRLDGVRCARIGQQPQLGRGNAGEGTRKAHSQHCEAAKRQPTLPGALRRRFWCARSFLNELRWWWQRKVRGRIASPFPLEHIFPPNYSMFYKS
ncbi:MAG TPA: hypothetical protein PKD55_06910 [Bellilinea sp.]|nr:hypothetical protein [Bellilinea sp.]